MSNYGNGLGALAGVGLIISVVFAIWLFVAPLIMTIQLGGINRKLKAILDRGTAVPPQQYPPRV
jgi:hypothetical protein